MTNLHPELVAMLTTPADCDALIAEIQGNDYPDAEFRFDSETRSLDSLASRVTKRESDITATQTQITSYDTVIAGLPDGDIKDDLVYKKTLEEHKLFRLQNSTSTTPVKLALADVDKQVAERKIGELDDLIALINTHKATL